VPNDALFVGESSVEDYGEPARATSVRRRVYSASGKLLFDTTWSSSYVAEPKIVQVGTKDRPKPKKKPKPPPPPPTTTGEEEPPPPPTTTEEAPPPPPPAGRPN
jgi:hypothetical protein